MFQGVQQQPRIPQANALKQRPPLRRQLRVDGLLEPRHGPAFPRRPKQQPQTVLRRFQTQQRPRVALAEPCFAQCVQYLRRMLEDAKLVRNGGLALADPPRRLLLTHAVLPHQPRKPFRLFYIVQILPLQVFNQCEQARILLVHAQNDARYLSKSRHSCGAQAPFPRHKLPTVLRSPHTERLQYAKTADRLRQLPQCLRVKLRARLCGIRADARDRQVDDPAAFGVEASSPGFHGQSSSPVNFSLSPAKKPTICRTQKCAKERRKTQEIVFSSKNLHKIFYL